MSRIRVDWFRVIVEIERQGYSLARIGEAIDVARSTVQGWRNLNAEPKHADGERLIVLWCRVVPQPPEVKVPRDALPLNVFDLMSAAEASRSKGRKSRETVTR